MKTSRNRIVRKLLLPLLLASGMAAAETGVLTKDCVLHDQPYSDATATGKLSGKSTVTVISRQGGWIQIRAADGSNGWVRIFDVRTGSGQAGQSGVNQLASVFKTGSSGDTVSTGVGGFNNEGDALERAQPNPAEDAKLGQYVSNSADAKLGAVQVRLSAQQVDWLPGDKR
jgi:hypothetical protein